MAHLCRPFRSRSVSALLAITVFALAGPSSALFERAAPVLEVIEPRDGARYTAAQARRLPIQLRLRGGEISPHDYRLALTINGRRHITTDWMPGALSGLGEGRQHLVVELLDRRGNPVEGASGRQEVVFHIGAARPRAASGAGSPRSAVQVEERTAVGAYGQIREVSRRYLSDDQPAPAAGVGPAVTDPSGFSVRTGGRREGPVPDLERPLPSRGNRAQAPAVSAGTGEPSGQGPAATAPERPVERTTSDDRQSTASAAMLERLEATGRRIQGRRTQGVPDEAMTVVRGGSATTTVVDGSASTPTPAPDRE